MSIDKHIKKVFDDQKFEFKEEYWQAASKLIDTHQQKKKRKVIIWWSSSIFFLILTLGAYFFMGRQVDLEKLSVNAAQETKTKTLVEPSESIKTHPLSNQQVPVQAEKTLSKNQGKERPNASPITSRVNSSAALASGVLESKKHPSFRSTGSGNLKTSSENLSTANFEKKTPTSVYEDNSKEMSSGNYNDITIKKPAIPSAIIAGDQNTSKPMLNQLQEATLEACVKMQQRPIKPLLSSTQNQALTKNFDNINYFSPFWVLGAYVGVHSSDKKLQINSVFDQGLQAKKQHEEIMQKSWNAGLEAMYVFNPHWSISSGIDYIKYQEQLNYSALQKQEVDVQDNSYFEIQDTLYWSGGWVQVNGNPVYYHNTSLHHEIDTMRVEQIDSNYYQVMDEEILKLNGSNKISYIELPLMIGYQAPFKALQIQAQTGLSFAFLHHKDIRYALQSKAIQDQSDLSVSSQVYNWVFRLSVMYPIARKTFLYVQPAFKKQLNASVTYKDAFQQRFTSYHVNVGVRFMLR